MNAEKLCGASIEARSKTRRCIRRAGHKAKGSDASAYHRAACGMTWKDGEMIAAKSRGRTTDEDWQRAGRLDLFTK